MAIYIPDEFWPDRVSYDIVHESMYQGPAALALAFVIEVLRQSPEADIPKVTHMLVEPFVKEHTPEIIEELEHAAATNEALRQCLGRIKIMSGELPPDMLARLVRASGGALTVHPEGAWVYLSAAT